MAETNTGPQKTFHLANNILALLLVVVAIVAFAGGWFAAKHKNTGSSPNNAVQTTMRTYQNKDNGFQLMYPSDWRAPNLTKTDNSGSTYYMLTFYKQPSGNLKYSIVLTMSKGNLALTSDSVKTVLQQKKSELAVSDDSSYATAASSSKFNTSSLTDVQTVNLSKIGVSAATLTYSINGTATSCAQNKFATDTSGNCIAKTDYDTVNQVMKSIKAL